MTDRTTTANGKVYGFSRLQLAALVAAVMVLAVIGSTYGSRLLVHSVNRGDLVDEVAGALVVNCEKNFKYRLQARQRTRANDLGTRLQIRANEALADVVHEIQADGTSLRTISLLGQRLRRVNNQLREIRAESTALLPLPNCDDYRGLLSD